MRFAMMLLLLVVSVSLIPDAAVAQPPTKRESCFKSRVMSLLIILAAAVSADPAQLQEHRQLGYVDKPTEKPETYYVAPINNYQPKCKLPAMPKLVLPKRKMVSSLSPGEWLQYREVVQKGQVNGVNSAMGKINGDHGAPKYYCPHGNIKFLPWHRQYLRRMEKALGGASLPYWDWTTQAFPPQYSTPTYTDKTCKVLTNPLTKGMMNDGKYTNRETPRVGSAQLKAQVLIAMASKTFEEFSQNIEFAHNSVHGQIGGAMGQVSVAAYDPIFWAHHTFVDYVWYQWQLKNPNAVYPAEAKGPMVDSSGTFSGDAQIKNLADWKRPGRLLREEAEYWEDKSGLDKEVIAYVTNLPPCVKRCKIEVLVNGVVVGTTYQPGMSMDMMKNKGNVRYSGPILCSNGHKKLVSTYGKYGSMSYNDISKIATFRTTEYEGGKVSVPTGVGCKLAEKQF